MDMERSDGNDEGIAGGVFLRTDSSCFACTDGGRNVGSYRKARLEGCLSHFFKWAMTSGFSVFKHAFRKTLKECG